MALAVTDYLRSLFNIRQYEVILLIASSIVLDSCIDVILHPSLC